MSFLDFSVPNYLFVSYCYRDVSKELFFGNNFVMCDAGEVQDAEELVEFIKASVRERSNEIIMDNLSIINFFKVE